MKELGKKQEDLLFHTQHFDKHLKCFIYNKFSFRIFGTWPLWQVCETLFMCYQLFDSFFVMLVSYVLFVVCFRSNNASKAYEYARLGKSMRYRDISLGRSTNNSLWKQLVCTFHFLALFLVFIFLHIRIFWALLGL